MKHRLFALGMLLFLPLNAVRATLEIEITQSANIARPIAIVPFAFEGQGKPPLDVAQIVSADLARSGKFKPLASADMLETPHSAAEIDFKNWRVLGVEHIVVGKIVSIPDGYAVQFQLFDVYRGAQLAGFSVPIPANDPRRAAHRVSDLVYEKITGEPGAFSTRVLFVSGQRQQGAAQYALMVADADGYNQQALLKSAAPIMSPAWSPDGKRIAYVSFESKHAAIYLQDLVSGKRERISARAGINGAPVFSPDGSRLALVLSTEPGNPDIYALDLSSRKLTRVTDSPAIDTEPAWLPDGKRLAFTSDRGGGPQIYQVELESGATRRLTFEGSYNTRPRVSPDGKQLALVHRDRTGFHIAVMDLRSGVLRVLTDGALDESPDFAPNGSMIIYATEYRGRGVLAAVSTDGRTKQRLAATEGDVREPVWSPLPPSGR